MYLPAMKVHDATTGIQPYRYSGILIGTICLWVDNNAYEVSTTAHLYLSYTETAKCI